MEICADKSIRFQMSNKWDEYFAQEWIYYSRKQKWGLTKRRLCVTILKLSGAPYRGVEQLEARRAHNPEVVGSSPASATINSPEIVRFQDFFFTFRVKKFK